MYPYRVSPKNIEAYQHFLSKGNSPLVSAVLASRGLTTSEEAEALLHPSAKLCHDPFLLNQMAEACARIQQGIATGEGMAVYGDYDVDGITATALLTDFLQSLGGKVIPYIPQRMGEGYGLNEVALEELFRKGIRLVITVDCGVSGKDQVAFATALGIDIIITDHHSCPQELPKAVAIVNPRIKPYPFFQLAGVGVALKLAQGLTAEENREAVFHRYSDLVAVGTVADVMPMEGENRYFVREGLKKLNENPSFGLKILLEETGMNERSIGTSTIGFNLAPRINAAGRLDQTEIALNLLLENHETNVREYAQQLCRLNSERQAIEGEIYQQCLQKLEEKPPERMVFLADSAWHPGVVGIVASRLGERYKMPAVMICCRDGIGKGSCRTFGNLDLYELLTNASDLLLGFGGHAQAAGFTVAEENIQALESQLMEGLRTLPPPVKRKILPLDARATLNQLNLEEVEALALLEPAGAGCSRPSFLLERAEVVGASLVGGGKHLRLRLQQNGEELSGIFFHYTGEPVYIGAILDVAFHLQVNHFRGISTPQLQIFSMTLSQEKDSFYQRWKRGALLSEEEQRELYPDSTKLLDLWKTFRETSLPTAASLSELCLLLEERAELPFLQGEVALAVFRERGWVKLVEKSGVCSLDFGEKAPESLMLEDLAESAILHYLCKA